MEKQLRIDYTNVISDGNQHPDVQKHLVSEAELDGLSKRVLDGHRCLEEKRQHGEIGFYDLPDADVSDTLALARQYRTECDSVVVLGIGGSALGTIAVATALLHPWHNLLSAEQRNGAPRLFVLDNIDSREMAALLDMLDPARTVFNVISKSGETAETMAQFLIVSKWLQESLGDRWTQRVVMTTGPGEASSGQQLVGKLGLSWLPVPENVGGRFSVLTPVGLFPLAMVGVDVEALLDGARAIRERCLVPELRDNPAYTLAALLYLLNTTKSKNIAVLMPYGQPLRDLADWFRQLWAESLGKKNKAGTPVGQTPVKARGVTDQHSQMQLYIDGPNDKVVMFVEVQHTERDMHIPDSLPRTGATGYLTGNTLTSLLAAEKVGTELSLLNACRPNLTITLPEVNAHTVGQLLFLFETATAMAGELYGVNAFDQPAVQQIKDTTRSVLGRGDRQQPDGRD